jgi:uncharacterized protein (TIGR02246 family)
MNRLSLLIPAVLMTAVATLAETPRSADEAAIKAQLYGYAAARTQGEGHAQALFYTEDGDEWGSAAREMTKKGREAIEKTLNQAPNPNRVFRVEPINYSFLGDDVALVDATYGGADPAGHALYVMVKRDGKWLIRSARIMRYPPTK